MTTFMAATAAALFAIGTYLLMQRKLSRLIIGLGLIGHGANVVFVTATRRGEPPIIGTGDPADFADPMPQPLVLPLAGAALSVLLGSSRTAQRVIGLGVLTAMVPISIAILARVDQD